MSSLHVSQNTISQPPLNLRRRCIPNLGREVRLIKGRRPSAACLSVDVEAPDAASKLGILKSKEVMETEAKVLLQTYARTPVVLTSGNGCKLYDTEGREYLDLSSGIAVNALGHGDEDWLKAVVDQAGTLTHVSNLYYSIPQVELAKRLVSSSFADRVFFTNSGTEANEAAIKFARKFQRHNHPDAKEPATGFISFTNSFHGRTMGALALTSKEHYRSPFEPVMPGVTFVEYGNIQATKELIQPGKTAAVFVEPIQGEGGIYSASKEFLQFLRTACDDAGALLVFDEVQCGLGRTGYLWAHEAYGVFPDIMTLAKPLAGGLPIGAALMTERVASAIAFGDHGSTFAGAPLICSAALAVLDKISNPKFLNSVSKKGIYFKNILKQKLGGNPHVREIRGLGLIIGIELDVSASPVVDAWTKSDNVGLDHSVKLAETSVTSAVRSCNMAADVSEHLVEDQALVSSKLDSVPQKQIISGAHSFAKDGSLIKLDSNVLNNFQKSICAPAVNSLSKVQLSPVIMEHQNSNLNNCPNPILQNDYSPVNLSVVYPGYSAVASIEMQSSEVVSCSKDISCSPCGNGGLVGLFVQKDNLETELGIVSSCEQVPDLLGNYVPKSAEAWERNNITNGRDSPECSQLTSSVEKNSFCYDNLESNEELSRKRKHIEGELQSGYGNPDAKNLTSRKHITRKVLPRRSVRLISK